MDEQGILDIEVNISAVLISFNNTSIRLRFQVVHQTFVRKRLPGKTGPKRERTASEKAQRKQHTARGEHRN